MPEAAPTIVAIESPDLDLDQATWDFAETLRREQRPGAKTSPSLINRLISAGAPRFGAVVGDKIVGMCRVERDGTTSIIVLRSWRNRGLGRHLLNTAIDHAADTGPDALVLQSTRRSRAVAALGRSFGARFVDQGCGRMDLVIGTSMLAQPA